VTPRQRSLSLLDASRRGVLPTVVAIGGAFALALGPVSAASAAPALAPGVTTVSTSAQLRTALDTALPGSVIELRDGTYTGSFRSSRSGTKAAPITLRGSRDAVLTTGSLSGAEPALTLSGKAWALAGFTVRKAPTGIVLSDSDNSVIDDVAVTSVGARGIHLRRNSSYVTVRNAVVSNTGLTSPGSGEGVYVGSARADWASVTGSASTPDRSDHARVEHTSFLNTTAEGVDIREGTTGARVAWNIFDNAGHSTVDSGDSWVDVRGNDTSAWANAGFGSPSDAFQVHTDVQGWGTGNRFRDNVVMENVPGYEVHATDAKSGTIVYCTYSNAGKGLSNIPCTKY
jgi:hypothetical protein